MIDTGGYRGRQTREEVLVRLSDGDGEGWRAAGGGGGGEGRPLMASWHSSSAPLIKIHVQPHEKCMTPPPHPVSGELARAVSTSTVKVM